MAGRTVEYVVAAPGGSVFTEIHCSSRHNAFSNTTNDGGDGIPDSRSIAERAVAESDRLLCTLLYLPAIFIRNHSWYLAATSR